MRLRHVYKQSRIFGAALPVDHLSQAFGQRQTSIDCFLVTHQAHNCAPYHPHYVAKIYGGDSSPGCRRAGMDLNDWYETTP